MCDPARRVIGDKAIVDSTGTIRFGGKEALRWISKSKRKEKRRAWIAMAANLHIDCEEWTLPSGSSGHVTGTRALGTSIAPHTTDCGMHGMELQWRQAMDQLPARPKKLALKRVQCLKGADWILVSATTPFGASMGTCTAGGKRAGVCWRWPA